MIGDTSNHIGLRLRRHRRRRPAGARTGDEVLSRGVPIGAVEVPAGDELMVLHRGRGVTAGYPVLAVVTATGLSRLGQARPGQSVSFARVPLAKSGRSGPCRDMPPSTASPSGPPASIRAHGSSAAGLNHDVFAAVVAVAS